MVQSFLLLFLALAIIEFQSCRAAIGDSRLRIAITNLLPATFSPAYAANKDAFASSAMHHGATVRLYDPMTDLTYHHSSDSRLIEVLGKMWNPLYFGDKCGFSNKRILAANLSSLKGTRIQRIETLICDPEGFFQPSQAREIVRIINLIPKTTGCQCDSLRHCNQYNSGFTVYVAVVPISLDKSANPKKNKGGRNKTQIPPPPDKPVRSSAGDDLLPPVHKMVSKTKSRTPAVNIQPSDVVIPRELSGVHFDLVPKDSDIYELLPLYLRVSWATGECDEDMVICFFPKDNRISLSLGRRLFMKLTATCLNSLVSDTLAKMSNKPKWNAAIDETAFSGSLSINNGSQTMAIDMKQMLRKNSSRERNNYMAAIAGKFIENLNALIQSRQDDPCAPIIVTKWSHYDILGFASVAGLSLSVSVIIMLRICSLIWRFIDVHYDKPVGIRNMFRRKAKEVRRRETSAGLPPTTSAAADNNVADVTIEENSAENANESKVTEVRPESSAVGSRFPPSVSYVSGINDTTTEEVHVYEAVEVSHSSLKTSAAIPQCDYDSLNNESTSASCTMTLIVAQPPARSPGRNPSSRPTPV